MQTLPAGERVASDAQVERNGREYLITTPDGAVFVALTLAEALAIADLWRTRQPSITASAGRRG